ncbi:MAG: hypothetical protein KAX30_04245 [Candidatus Atribacteria bacterium]|nr:hypothetical protein [Candidatus Atribacteria bacterium]
MEFLKYLWLLLKDQRGAVGDDPPPDDPPQDDKIVDDDDSSDDDVDDDIKIDIKDKDKKDDKDKLDADAVKELQGQVKEFGKDKKSWEEKIDKLEEDKKNLNTALHQARQDKKTIKTDEAAPLTRSQLKQILEDNPSDVEAQFNVLEYLAEQKAKGVTSEAINATEVNRKKGELDNFLVERYPDIKKPDSDIRKEVDETKTVLGLNKHPYGDYFAIAARVLDELPDLLKKAYEDGKSGKSKKDIEDARTDAIKKGKLPPSKKDSSKDTESLTKEQDETFTQMGLTDSQKKIAKKLVAKKIRTVSVEE